MNAMAMEYEVVVSWNRSGERDTKMWDHIRFYFRSGKRAAKAKVVEEQAKNPSAQIIIRESGSFRNVTREILGK